MLNNNEFQEMDLRGRDLSLDPRAQAMCGQILKTFDDESKISILRQFLQGAHIYEYTVFTSHAINEEINFYIRTFTSRIGANVYPLPKGKQSTRHFLLKMSQYRTPEQVRRSLKNRKIPRFLFAIWNRWLTSAGMFFFGRIAFDALTGPSAVLIVTCLLFCYCLFEGFLTTILF